MNESGRTKKTRPGPCSFQGGDKRVEGVVGTLRALDEAEDEGEDRQVARHQRADQRAVPHAIPAERELEQPDWLRHEETVEGAHREREAPQRVAHCEPTRSRRLRFEALCVEAARADIKIAVIPRLLGAHRALAHVAFVRRRCGRGHET